MALPDMAGADDVPEWVHLLPAGEIRTIDGRGPYRCPSLQSVAALMKPGKKLPIDENHATDKGGKALGMPAPARGWIVALQARDDGLWGQVEWTGEGRRLMADKAYAGISPAILHNKAGDISQVLRASLTNTPNLEGLTALHSEEGNGMDFKAWLIELLKLDSEVDDEAIKAALSAKLEAPEAALQSQQDIITHPKFLSLQSELGDVTGRLNALLDNTARDKATSYVDGEIARGRVGLKPVRDEYITLHMQDADKAVKLIAAMPVINGSSHAGQTAPTTDDKGLDSTDRQVMALFSVSEDDYLAGLGRAGLKKEAL